MTAKITLLNQALVVTVYCELEAYLRAIIRGMLVKYANVISFLKAPLFCVSQSLQVDGLSYTQTYCLVSSGMLT